jgi:multiple sugar transport system substrate-binding protein
MKYLFLTIFLTLSLLSLLTWMSFPDMSSDTPVIYWVTDSNPARKLQVETFHEWLIKNDHVNEHGKPIVQLKLDTGNRDTTKQVIQGVSGVGADIMDLSGSGKLRSFEGMGLLENLNAYAKEKNFGLDKTYKAMRTELSIERDGQVGQYGFPCNVYAAMWWVNRSTFENLGLSIPNKRWTFDEMETLGMQLKNKAAEMGRQDPVFIIDGLSLNLSVRSMGIDLFNETMTRCQANDKKFIDMLERIYRWTYDLGIIPTSADKQSFDTKSGYGGASLALFKRGDYACFQAGRFALVGLRQSAGLKLSVVEPPHDSYPNVQTGTRCAALYAGGKNKALASLFLSYLASEDYNRTIVKGGDALPPNPLYTKGDDFIKPVDYPNEKGCHEPFSDAMDTIAIPVSNSPYIMASVVDRILTKWQDNFMNQRCSAQEAAKMIEEDINDEITRNVMEMKHLNEPYMTDLEVQEKIDRLRISGDNVPEKWVKNPFYQKYGRDLGWIQE